MLYYFDKSLRENTIEITFDCWDPHPYSRDPFFALVEAYAEHNHLEIKTVDEFYNYKFLNDPFDILFYWNAAFFIYVFVPAARDISEIKSRLDMIISEQNTMLSQLNYERYPGWEP